MRAIGRTVSEVRCAALWRKITGSTEGPPPDFGDFGVSHPVAPPRSGRFTIPHLRYTVADDWVVHVADRQSSGNDDFFPICPLLYFAAVRHERAPLGVIPAGL
jgi:hypothetical protein